MYVCVQIMHEYKCKQVCVQMQINIININVIHKERVISMSFHLEIYYQEC